MTLLSDLAQRLGGRGLEIPDAEHMGVEVPANWDPRGGRATGRTAPRGERGRG